MDEKSQLDRQLNDIETSLFDKQWQIVTEAVNSGIDRYITSRKVKVPEFVDRHFSFKGALQLHRKAIGSDLIKAPFNLFWLVPLTISRIVSHLSEKVGQKQIAKILKRLPPGWETNVQKEINWLIYTELLELPYRQGNRESTKDALLEEILNDPALNEILTDYLDKIKQKSTDPNFRQTLEQNLQEYATSRIAVSELANSLIMLSTNLAAFHKAAPGALSTGSALAGIIAEKIAISQFWLGPALGAWYYSIFPATASTGLIVAATGSVLAGLALLSTLTGIITDPVQAKLGLHQKRLYKFLDALHAELKESKNASYQLKEQYIARVLDILDLLTAALRR
jgi:hypothetical protein